MTRARTRAGREVEYYPTAQEALAFGDGPWPARITRVNADGTAELALTVPAVDRDSVVRTFGTVTSHVLTLPDESKCERVLRGFAIAGSSAGEKTPMPMGDNVGTAGEVAPQSNGNVIFNATDAVTSAEVVYVRARGRVIEETLTPSSHNVTLSEGRRASLLLEAEVLTGTDAGDKTVTARGTAAPGDNLAALDADGQGVQFAAADAATSVRIKYVAMPGQGDQPPMSITHKSSVGEGSKGGQFSVDAGPAAL